MKIQFLATTITVCLSPSLWAQSVEYLPGIEWPEPQVVTPSENNTGPPSDAIVLFNGKDLSAWEGGENWKIEHGVAIVNEGNLHTKQAFGDCQLHVEWSAPLPAKGTGQGRGNSGIYMMGMYEVQVLDSFENKTYFEGQAGAIYKQTPPMVNAIRPPGQWNVYDIIFTAPRFDEDGSLKSPAYMTILHNGVLVQNHFELVGPTQWHEPTRYSYHPSKLPIMLQDHGNPVRYRNIWVREFKQLTGKQVAEPGFINHTTGRRWKASEVGTDHLAVKGSVTLNDQPLDSCRILFSSEGSGPEYAVKVAEGEFEFEFQGNAGMYLVTILNSDAIPERFANRSTTSLKVDLRPGKNALSFDLVSK